MHFDPANPDSGPVIGHSHTQPERLACTLSLSPCLPSHSYIFALDLVQMNSHPACPITVAMSTTAAAEGGLLALVGRERPPVALVAEEMLLKP